ncbi:hypothetical protein [Aquirhabdus parva]|uniref:Uncharacterized protein n=1 Tax=Aquirhabdus parva TaxID=2283318 RepID=A0A345PAV9_9GAMM|nr:hypothetical protein [Aquirhabdus parva]AXI01425.1 hypothetical protein HYN46_00020 [Aquirhabdus parva]AXI04371.1 hypothetical protein HYN46_16935 [Aquirhabdus parva]AXI04418.1 hypothetical protein HYN46_17190 [Aquirhabdus parva]
MKPVLSLLREAARKANLIASGENLNADQEQESLEALNTLLDGWALTLRNGSLPQSVKVTDTLYLPDGYASAIMYNLAVQISVDNELQIDPEVQQMALNTLSAVRRDGTAPLKSKGDTTLSRMSRRHGLGRNFYG